ncbi:hypothetical protein NFI96_027346, partial [Prochilodus magdalenae]
MGRARRVSRGEKEVDHCETKTTALHPGPAPQAPKTPVPAPKRSEMEEELSPEVAITTTAQRFVMKGSQQYPVQKYVWLESFLRGNVTKQSRDIVRVLKVRQQINGPHNAPFAQKSDLGLVIGEVCIGKAGKPDVRTFKTHVLENGHISYLKPCDSCMHMKEKVCHGGEQRDSFFSACKPHLQRDTGQNLGHSVFQTTKSDHKLALSVEYTAFLEIMNTEVYRDEENNWVAPLPFRVPQVRLPNNRRQALSRLTSLCRMLERRPVMKQQFLAFMEKIFADDHAEPVTPVDRDKECCLLGVHIRFRKEQVVIMADIQRMFYCFRVREDHRDVLRFLWFRNNNATKDIRQYRMKLMVEKHLVGKQTTEEQMVEKQAMEGEPELTVEKHVVEMQAMEEHMEGELELAVEKLSYRKKKESGEQAEVKRLQQKQEAQKSKELLNWLIASRTEDGLEIKESEGLYYKILKNGVGGKVYDIIKSIPTERGLHQHLDLLEKYCQNWALTVNPDKSKIMIFQKKARSQESRHMFHLGDTALDHTLSYNYLGLKISASGGFGLAVNALKEKACRALYSIRKPFSKIHIPIRIWLKIFNSVMLPIALY